MKGDIKEVLVVSVGVFLGSVLYKLLSSYIPAL